MAVKKRGQSGEKLVFRKDPPPAPQQRRRVATLSMTIKANSLGKGKVMPNQTQSQKGRTEDHLTITQRGEGRLQGNAGNIEEKINVLFLQEKNYLQKKVPR